MLVALAFPSVSPLLWKRDILGVLGLITNQPIWGTKEAQVSEILLLLDEFSCDDICPPASPAAARYFQLQHGLTSLWYLFWRGTLH